MKKIESRVSRSWPAYGIEVPLGVSYVASISAQAERLLLPLVEAGLVVITDGEPEPTPSQEPESAPVDAPTDDAPEFVRPRRRKG